MGGEGLFCSRFFYSLGAANLIYKDKTAIFGCANAACEDSQGFSGSGSRLGDIYER